MLVNIWLSLTKAVITGDVDEVRVQSEEPYLRSLLRKLSRLFAFSVAIKSPLISTLPALHPRYMPHHNVD